MPAITSTQPSLVRYHPGRKPSIAAYFPSVHVLLSTGLLDKAKEPQRRPALRSAKPCGLGVGAANARSVATEKYEMYVVKAGDTLSAIAKHFYGNADTYLRIFSANRDTLENPDKIYAGRALRIPKD